MPVDDGVTNWTRGMRRAVDRAEAHARKWKVNYVAGITNQPPVEPPVEFRRPELTPEQRAVVDEMAEKVGCVCDTIAEKKDDMAVCVDLWGQYLQEKMDLEQLKQAVDGYFGEGTFDRAGGLAKQRCPV